MSYELQWTHLPRPVEAARQAWIASLVVGYIPVTRERRLDYARAVNEAPETCYLRLNISAMALVRERALSTTMAYPARLPRWEDYGLRKTRTQSVASRAEENGKSSIYEEFHRAMDIYSWSGVAGMRGIPSYKLESNGPWYVPP